MAALLIIAERVGKATRNPPRDAMLSHAAKEMGYGWGFGVHEALDQFGALFGTLLVALVLAVSQHDYELAFAAALVAAGLADFPLIAFHLQQSRTVAAPTAGGLRGRLPSSEWRCGAWACLDDCRTVRAWLEAVICGRVGT